MGGREGEQQIQKLLYVRQFLYISALWERYEGVTRYFSTLKPSTPCRWNFRVQITLRHAWHGAAPVKYATATERIRKRLKVLKWSYHVISISSKNLVWKLLYPSAVTDQVYQQLSTCHYKSVFLICFASPTAINPRENGKARCNAN